MKARAALTCVRAIAGKVGVEDLRELVVVKGRVSSRKQIALSQRLEEPPQRQHTQRTVLQLHRAGVNANAGLDDAIIH